jgi:hypothetical protein
VDDPSVDQFRLALHAVEVVKKHFATSRESIKSAARPCREAFSRLGAALRRRAS